MIKEMIKTFNKMLDKLKGDIVSSRESEYKKPHMVQETRSLVRSYNILEKEKNSLMSAYKANNGSHTKTESYIKRQFNKGKY